MGEGVDDEAGNVEEDGDGDGDGDGSGRLEVAGISEADSEGLAVDDGGCDGSAATAVRLAEGDSEELADSDDVDDNVDEGLPEGELSAEVVPLVLALPDRVAVLE